MPSNALITDDIANAIINQVAAEQERVRIQRYLTPKEFKVWSLNADGSRLIEIAENTGQTYSAVASALNKARKKIAERRQP